MYVTRITDLSSIKVTGVDFGSPGATGFSANVASEGGGGKIKLHLDQTDCPVIGTLPVTATGGLDEWQTMNASVSGATGKHDLFLVSRGKGEKPLFNFDKWSFAK